MAATGVIDPTKPGKYPVILSDELLGKPSQETYTGVRYNHWPALSSDTAPDTARLKKSAKDDSYNFGFDDQGNKYQYNGVRTSNDDNYVLIFDPSRKAFVLHRVDSTFHMNLTRTPTESNVETLRKQFPHLEVKGSKTARQQSGKSTDKSAAAKAKESNTPSKSTPKAKGGSKPEKAKAVALTLPDVNAAPAKAESLPMPPPPPTEPEKKKRREPSPVESEEEEDDDDDGGLTVEYPGGNPAAFQPTSHAFPVAVTRRFSEFARDIERGEEEEDDGEDAGHGFGGGTDRGYGGYGDDEAGYEEEEEEEDDEEEEEEEEEDLQPQKPPVVAEEPVAVEPDRYTFDDGDDDGDNDFGDLEAEMEREFDKVQSENKGHESDESVSEEE
ncbi:hypothetical protein VTK26DRAFT_5888 [Humicola hyalothermophila]